MEYNWQQKKWLGIKYKVVVMHTFFHTKHSKDSFSSTRILSILIFLLLVNLLPCTVGAQDHSVPTRLLFLGNSFTYRNGGLEMHIKKLDSSTHRATIVQSNRATKGGATLKILYQQPWVHDSIHHQQYDVVILQEDIPEITAHNTTSFDEYATLFNQEIRATGARSVLFMAWPYERLNWITMEQIAAAHKALGAQLQVPVAPVGLAFQQSLKVRPAMAMLGPDKEHATIQGTYLEACVVYATLYGRKVKKVTYFPVGVDAEQADFLRKLAWETVKAWKNWKPASINQL
jgi:hypothetical protein